MPLYSYTHTCGHKWNEMKKISERDEPLNSPCPHCGEKENITKDVGAPNLADPYRIQGTTSGKVPSDMKEIFQRIDERSGTNLSSRYK